MDQDIALELEGYLSKTYSVLGLTPNLVSRLSVTIALETVVKRWPQDNLAGKKQSRKGKGPSVSSMSKLELIFFCDRRNIVYITLLALCKYADVVTKNNKG